MTITQCGCADARKMGVPPGEIVDERKMGASPGENDECYSAVARKTGSLLMI